MSSSALKKDIQKSLPKVVSAPPCSLGSADLQRNLARCDAQNITTWLKKSPRVRFKTSSASSSTVIAIESGALNVE